MIPFQPFNLTFTDFSSARLQLQREFDLLRNSLGVGVKGDELNITINEFFTASGLSGLTAPEVLFAASPTTVGQDKLFNYHSTTHALSVGFSGSLASGMVGYFANPSNGQNILAMGNSGAGTSAIASIYATNSDSLAGSQAGLIQYGSSFATSGLLGANVAQLIKSGTAANLLVSNSGASGDIVFTTTVSTTERARIASGGNVSIVNLNAGGIVKATAATGVLAIAVAGTDYQAALSLTAPDVLFASGASTVGQDNAFNYVTGTGMLSVPKITASGGVVEGGAGGTLSLQNNSGIATSIAIGPTEIDVKGSIVPTASLTYNLGSTTELWTTVFASAVTGNGGSNLALQDANTPNTSITLTNTAISTVGNILPSPTATYSLGSSVHEWVGLNVATITRNGSVSTLNFANAAGAAAVDLQTTGASTFRIEHSGSGRWESGATGISFFGAGLAAQQTGGAATAGATYTATEQGMLNRAYGALRTYGLLT